MLNRHTCHTIVLGMLFFLRIMKNRLTHIHTTPPATSSDHRDCLVLDRDRQLGRVQFDYLTGEIKRLLNTTPDRHAPVIEDEAEEAVA